MSRHDLSFADAYDEHIWDVYGFLRVGRYLPFSRTGDDDCTRHLEGCHRDLPPFV